MKGEKGMKKEIVKFSDNFWDWRAGRVEYRKIGQMDPKKIKRT